MQCQHRRSLPHLSALCRWASKQAHFVSSTLEDLQSSHAMRFLCKYANPLAESKATCLPLQPHNPTRSANPI